MGCNFLKILVFYLCLVVFMQMGFQHIIQVASIGLGNLYVQCCQKSVSVQLFPTQSHSVSTQMVFKEREQCPSIAIQERMRIRQIAQLYANACSSQGKIKSLPQCMGLRKNSVAFANSLMRGQFHSVLPSPSGINALEQNAVHTKKIVVMECGLLF